MIQFLKTVALIAILLIAGIYVFQMVMIFSPSADLFAPK